MVPIARRLIAKEKTRFAITAAGVGMVVALILLLFGIWEGVRAEANGYVRDRPVQIWVCQSNCTNLIRSSSFLSGSLRPELLRQPEVARVTPLLRLIGTSTIHGRRATFFVIGYDPAVPEGRPTITAGTAELRPGEMVVDHALAAKYGIGLGDSIAVNDRWFTVRGLSSGTNAVITQFVFVPFPDAAVLLGLPDMASYWLLNLHPGASPERVAAELQARLPNISAFTRDQFERNNQDEMRTGLLPILAMVATLGALIGAVVLMLLMYGHVLEHRSDYAILKAIGAGQSMVAGVIIRQALLAACAGLLLGALVALIGAPLIRWAVPEVSLAVSWRVGLATLGVALLIGMLGSWLPVRRLARIYPAEVFRA